MLGLLILLVKGPKYEQKIKYRYVIPLVIAGFVAFGGVTQLALEKRVLSNYFGNIAFAYEDYGYPYCLATTIFNTGISERGIILRMRLTGSRRQSPIFQRPRRMERDRIFCSFSLSLSLTRHW